MCKVKGSSDTKIARVIVRLSTPDVDPASFLFSDFVLSSLFPFFGITAALAVPDNGEIARHSSRNSLGSGWIVLPLANGIKAQTPFFTAFVTAAIFYIHNN